MMMAVLCVSVVSVSLCTGRCTDEISATAAGRRSDNEERRRLSVHIVSHAAGDAVKVLHWLNSVCSISVFHHASCPVRAPGAVSK